MAMHAMQQRVLVATEVFKDRKQQPSALLSLTMAALVEHVSRFNATTNLSGASLGPSSSRRPTSALQTIQRPRTSGATLHRNTLT